MPQLQPASEAHGHNRTIALQRVMHFVACVIAVGVAATCAACGGDTNSTNLVHSEHISKVTFKGKWPVAPDAGTLACDATKGGSITFSPDGSLDVYAVNGTAMGGWAAQEGWKNVRDIWLPAGPDDFGPNVNIGDFIDEGQRLCDMNAK